MVRSGLVSTDFLKRNRKFALLILFILSGVLTPPDIISQAMLGGPMYLMYEAAILIGGRIEAHQRANNPYWDGGDPHADEAGEDDESDEFAAKPAPYDPNDDDANSIGGDQPGPEMSDDEIFAPVEDEQPRILRSTPPPSGDEGFVEPDKDD